MKKQILTFAVLATIAVGAAVAGNSKNEHNAKPAADPGVCVTDVDCIPSDHPDCEILGTEYSGNDGFGGCDAPMELIVKH